MNPDHESAEASIPDSTDPISPAEPVIRKPVTPAIAPPTPSNAAQVPISVQRTLLTPETVKPLPQSDDSRSPGVVDRQVSPTTLPTHPTETAATTRQPIAPPTTP